MPFLKRHWPWIFLLLIPLIPLWRAVFLGEAIGPFDQIRQMPPWNGPKPNQAWDVLQADGVLQTYVWRDLVFDAWGKGQVPHWNSYELAGTPLLANSQSGALYPLHILMGTLHIPTALAITLLAWFHLFWAGLGTFKLSRSLGATRLGGAVAGASFALSPFMLGWTSLASVITTVSWIPWLLYLTNELFRAPEPGEVKPHPIRTGVLFSVCLGMSLLGGHLQFAAYGAMAVAVVALFGLASMVKGAARRSWPGRVVTLVLSTLIGVGLALPQLLPVLEYSGTSHRRNTPTEKGYEDYTKLSLKPFELANLVSPKNLGDPRSAVEIGEGQTIAEYWPPLAKQGANFAESAVTVGPLVLGLLFLAPWRDRRTWGMATMAGLALLLALGTLLNKALYFMAPGWSSTGSPGRVYVLVLLGLCVLAGLGIRDEKPSKKSFGIAAGVMALTTLICALGLPGMAPTWLQGMDQVGEAIKGTATAGVMPSLLSALVLGIGGLALVALPEAHKYRKAVLAVPVLLGLSGLAMTAIQTGKPLAKVDGPADPTQRVAVINQNWGIVTAVPAFLPPNLAAVNRVHELSGYDSLLNRDTVAMLAEVSGQDAAPPANGNIMFVKPTFDVGRLGEAGVTEIWSARPIERPDVKPISSEGFYRYSIDGPGRASIDGRPLKILSEGYGRFKVEITGPGRFVLRERRIGSWIAFHEKGKFIPDGGKRWIEFDVPEGTYVVDIFRIESGFLVGAVLSGGAFLLVLGGLVGSQGRGVKNRHDPEPQTPSEA